MVALHVPGLTRLTADEQFIIGELLERSHDWGLDRFAYGGGVGNWCGSPVLAIEVVEGMDIEQGRLDWGDGRRSLTTAAPVHGSLVARLREAPDTTRRACFDTLAAHGAGAHFVVSGDRALLRLRDEDALRECNVVTPLEAGVLMGVWARATGRGGTFAHWSGSDHLYYWALTRAIAPAAWPGFAAFIYGERVFDNGERLAALAQSILARLDYLVEALDDLAVTWHRKTDNPTMDEMRDLFDGIVLRGWAIQDNVALLIGTWLGVDLPRPTNWSIHERAWRKAVRDAGPVGRSVIDRIGPTARRLRASEPLRHHAVHREAISAINVRTAAGAEEARLNLPAEISTEVRCALTNAGQSPAAWGLSPEIPALQTHCVIDHGDGLVDEFDEERGGGAYLEPMAFATRFVASTAELADRSFAALDPARDVRLPEALRVRAMRPPEPRWAQPDVAHDLILTSPLSGLVPWAAGRRSASVDSPDG